MCVESRSLLLFPVFATKRHCFVFHVCDIYVPNPVHQIKQEIICSKNQILSSRLVLAGRCNLLFVDKRKVLWCVCREL